MAALAATLCGLCVWTGLGAWVASRIGWQGAPTLAVAPALGWALQTTLALPLSMVTGFSTLSMLLSIALVIGGTALLSPHARSRPSNDSHLPMWIYVAAALIALLPASALLPKSGLEGMLLSSPIFDHSKIALIDQMIREGVPPANPVFGAAGNGVSYYYLWHFSAAELGRCTGASGWEADIAMTWFTAFSSLCLMAGLSFHFSRHVLAPVFVLLACLTGSLRAALALLFDQQRIDRVVEQATGLGGWLFQTAWSPHHVASATCVVLVALLMTQLGRTVTWLAAVVLGLLLAASFQSSLWVGGVVGPLSATAIFATTIALGPREHRGRLWLMALVSVAIAVSLCAPLLLEQLHAAALRGGGLPVRVAPQYVLGPAFPEGLRRLLDVPGYWAVLLVLEFPAVLFAGTALLLRGFLKRTEVPTVQRDIRPVAVLALISLCCGWLLFSTTGDNNDLGWRAVLPGLLLLTGAAGACFAQAFARRSFRIVAALSLIVLLAVPGGIELAQAYVTGMPSPSAAFFREAPSMWEAVRRHAPPQARVANDPALFADLTPWPVNISWALLANRRSCFAGNELALAFAPLSPERRLEIASRFERVFDGSASADEASRLMHEFQCSVVLLTARDGAWTRDPFAMNPSFEAVEHREDAWRVYVVKP